MKFINREEDLDFLEEKWGTNKSQFVVVYGRRRVGKTELIKQFIKNKSAIYFLSDQRPEREQLKELGRIVGNYFQDTILAARGFNDWIEVFRYLKEQAKKPFVFAIDEFPYLVGVNKAVSSLFQKGWDQYLKDSKVFFILSGSSISMMESEVLIYKAPLYGRRTGQILLKPFLFKDAHLFFPRKNFSDFLDIFTVTDGIPAYLEQFDSKISFKENVTKKIFRKQEFLHNEVEFILKEELREPKTYLAILRAIALGKTKFGEIINETGVERNVLTKYIHTLERLQLIEKRIPVTEKNLQKSRKGAYTIMDNFFRFWFQYVFPYKSDLELGRHNEVLRKMEESFNLLKSFVYERVCRAMVWHFQDRIFPFERAGGWWDKSEEIDVVALSERTKSILFGEVKWSNRQVGENIYEDLKRKAQSVRWGQGMRKEYYILFSKSGYTKAMLERAKKEKVFLVKQDELILGG